MLFDGVHQEAVAAATARHQHSARVFGQVGSLLCDDVADLNADVLDERSQQVVRAVLSLVLKHDYPRRCMI